MTTDSENRKQIRKRGNKILRRLSSSFAILLVLLSLWFEWTIDQESYLLHHKEVAGEPAQNAVITEFYMRDMYRSPKLYYAGIRCTYNGETEFHSVVRARSDYIGKTIPVKRLPSGGYIRSSAVLTHRFAICLERWGFAFLFIVMGHLLRWLKRKQKTM